MAKLNLRDVNRRLKSRTDVAGTVKSIRDELAEAEAAAAITAKDAVLMAIKAAVLVAIILGIWSPKTLNILNSVWAKAVVIGLAVIAVAIGDAALALLWIVLLIVVVLGAPVQEQALVQARAQTPSHQPELVPRSILKQGSMNSQGSKSVSFDDMSQLNEAPMVKLPLVSAREEEDGSARMEVPVSHELTGQPIWTPPMFRGPVDIPPQQMFPSPAAQNPVPSLQVTDAELGRLAYVSPQQLDAASVASVLHGDPEDLDILYPKVDQATTLLLGA